MKKAGVSNKDVFKAVDWTKAKYFLGRPGQLSYGGADLIKERLGCVGCFIRPRPSPATTPSTN